MPELAWRLLLVWATAANAFPLQTTTSVNISDAWLLTDGESPVFYRHFRDKVTWAEADSVCQFHHSVLATVRNTAEFDRTRALLRQLEWSTPVWVGLRRVDGQPMFKWSTPAGATLDTSEGYWHEPPVSATLNPQCVTIDPAADLRWRAVDCTSPLEIHSFLCQIPVPSWVRAEQGGCLSPKWPNKEVTVQYILQTRALEMIADCGLRGTRRIACKHNSEKDLEKLEQKLECGTAESSTMKAMTPSRPATRHRRDVNPSDAPTLAPINAPLTKATASRQSTTEMVLQTSAATSETPTQSATKDNDPPVTTSVPQPTTGEAVKEAKVSTTMAQPHTTEDLPEVAPTSAASPTPEEPKTEKVNLVPTPTASRPESTVTPTLSSKMNVEIIAHIFDTSTDGTAVSRVFTLQTEQQDNSETLNGQQEETMEMMQNTQPLVVAKHHVVPGTPRNVPSSVTKHDSLQHPPMAIPPPHHLAPGVPRIHELTPQQHQAPFLVHPMLHANGHPRLEEVRSAEDHVAQWRKQLLPTPLQGPTIESHHHPPLLIHAVEVASSTISVPEAQTESDKTEEEDIEFQDEEPEPLQVAKLQKLASKQPSDDLESTENTLNTETDEEIFEAENRLKGRRGEEKIRERHLARSLYPFILNRLLG